MSKGYSGLFEIRRIQSIGQEVGKIPMVYEATDKLKDHIINGSENVGASGINGAHNKENFTKLAEKNGIRIDSIAPNSQMDGVEKIQYSIPKKGRDGKPTSEFKASKKYKTVYNPNVISNDKYIRYGIEAANNAVKNSSTGKLKREWSGIDNQGIEWHGYCDGDGNITSFYPND